MEESQDLDEVVDLEAILNELELEEGADADEETVDEAKEEDEDKEDLDEAKPGYKADDVQYTSDKAEDIHEGCTDCGDDFDLDNLLEEISNVDLKENSKPVNKKPKTSSFYKNQINKLTKELNITKSELKETSKVLTSVKGELNEVNLLNSKLLYVNRIFKINNLDDGQKLRVIESFDKANSVKETKLIYETIKDTFSIKNTTKSVPKKLKSIKEGFGMASKAVKSTAPKKVITETDNMVTRMQKLANIKIKQ